MFGQFCGCLFRYLFASLFLVVFIGLYCGAAMAQLAEFKALEPQFQSTYPYLPLVNFNKVYQDSDGVLWLASDQGLYRFDGQKAVVLNSQNSDLANNVVFDIVGSGNHTLWLSTYGGGLVRFDLRTNRFETFTHGADLQSVSSDTLWDLEWDTQNQSLWIGSRRWLNQFNTQTGKSLRLGPESSPSLVINNNVWSLYQDPQRHLWIATLGGGLYDYDPTSHRVEQYNKQSGLSHDLVRTVIEDDDGKLWVGTDNGLNVFSRQTGEFIHYFHQSDDPYSLSSNEINKLFKDSHGDIWIGTYGAGLNRYDQQQQRFLRYNFASLGLNQARTPTVINDIFEDRQGILWVATDKGIIKLLPAAFASAQYGLVNGQNSSVTMVLGQGNNHWTAINNQLISFDRDSFAVNKAIELPGHVLTATMRDNHSLWLSIVGHGVFRLSLDTASYSYQLIPYDVGKNVSAIYAEDDSRLWLGLFRGEANGGLKLYQPKKGIVKSWFESDSIIDIERFDKDTLLLGTNNKGVILFNLTNFEHTRIINHDNETLNHIVDLYIDNDSRVWLGTASGGLARLSVAAQAIEPVAPSLGAVDWVIQTANDTLWVAANNLLHQYSIGDNTVNAYGESYGLAVNKFSKRTVLFDNQKLVFGTDQGLYRLNPTQKPLLSEANPISFTELRLFNRPVNLAHSLNHSDSLSLSYDDYLFSIGFAAPDYQHSDKQQFQYRLDGFDDRWISTDNANLVATYSSVPPGNYQFKVRVLQDEQPEVLTRSLAVTIDPPWWLTPFAYVAYVIATIAAVVLLINIRTRALTKRAITLEQGIAARTIELEQKSETIEVLLKQKQRLFTNISHELRTPLTLLLGPAEQLFKQLSQSPYMSAIGLIRRNALRMQHMVEQLLQLASLEAGNERQIQKQFRVICVAQALRQMVAAAEPLAQRKRQTLRLLNAPDVRLKMQEDAFEQIIGNLLSNAFKYSAAQQQVEIDAEVVESMVYISIKDSGYGIAEQYQALIFDRFERGAFASNSQLPGSGIGLALVKEWVEAHGGEIALTSELNKGSTFSVGLPLYLDGSNQGDDIERQYDNKLSFDGWLDDEQSSDELLLSQPVAQSIEQEDCPIVLIVEDNPDMRIHLINVLQHDYRCLTAANGQQGLELAREQVPNIIVCDVMMPVMDGFEFCQQVKQDQVLSHIPVVLLTALADQQNRIQGWQNQADDYLNKPFAEQELQLRLANLLALRAILRERYANEYRNDTQALANTKAELNQKDQQFIARFEQLIEQHFAEPEFQLIQAAEQMAMSERQLQRKLKAIMDMNFSQIVRRTRLQKASEMLKQGQAVNLVADFTGFSSAAYFSTCFKAQFGDSPKKLQQQWLEANRDDVRKP